MSRSKRDQQLRTSKRSFQSVDYWTDGPLLQAISVEQDRVPYVDRLGNARKAAAIMKQKKRKIERTRANMNLRNLVVEELSYPVDMAIAPEVRNINTFSF